GGGGMIEHVGSAPLGLGLTSAAAPLNNFSAAESVKRVSARGSRHRIAPSSAATLGQAPMAERPVVLPPESVKERAMPITPYLNGMSFHPKTKRVMGVAFEMVCAALRTGAISPTKLSRDASLNLPRPASQIPIFCVKVS